MSRAGAAALALLCALPGVSPAQASPAPPIADNSFLLEEAYNQERGVVQHINALLRSRDGTWTYSFTQEWPLFGQTSQLSFTVPVQRFGSGTAAATGLGDVAVNYRYQLVGASGTAAVAPRLSVLLPTGDETRGFGAGAAGMQVNVPVSVRVGSRLVTHWNAGATITPSATTGFNAGASAIGLLRPTLNLMLEVSWTRAEQREAGFLNPGLRWAHNFRSGLQIVPGIGFPIGFGPDRGERAVFFYLSFEHPFRNAGR